MKVIIRDGLTEKIDGPVLLSKTREGHVVETYTVDGAKRFFVTLSGSHLCAHGSTLAEAIADAKWKDPAQRPSLESVRDEIREAGAKRKITLSEFRLLTGACADGCRVALKRANLDGSPMTLKDIRKHFPEWGQKLAAILKGDE